MLKVILEICNRTEEEKERFVKTSGDILLKLCEGYNIWQIAEQFDMTPEDVQTDIYIMNYILRQQMGKKEYLKQLLIK